MTIEVHNHTAQPVEIRNFTKGRYIDAGYMEREWDKVWRSTWLLAGLTSDLESTGDFFVFDLGREQILVTRTPTGAVQGFFNVCQHRGNLLVAEERGHAVSFRCAYHAWTYNLDGELAIVPYEERFLGSLGGVQRGMASAGFSDVFLNEDELRVQHFHNRLDELI